MKGLCSSPLFITLHTFLKQKVALDGEILQTALMQTKDGILQEGERNK